MTSLTFTAVYGEETRIVEISSPAGGGDGSFHIMERRAEGLYYIGSVIRYLNVGWTVVAQEADRFTVEDKNAILDRMIEAGLIGTDEVVNRG